MKKLIVILLTFLMLISVLGCHKQENKYPERDVTYSDNIEAFNEQEIYIHYQRKDNSYANWTLWLWNPDGSDDSCEDDFNYQDDYGVIAAYPLSKFGVDESGKLGIIVKTKGAWTKDGTEEDRFIVFSELTKDDKGVYHVYLASDDPHIYTTSEKIVTDDINTCEFYNESLIYVKASNPIESYKIYCDDEVIKEESNAGKTFFSANLEKPVDFTKEYKVEVLFRGTNKTITSDVSLAGLYGTESFNSMYYYDGELGAIYTKNATEFKVWSPVSNEILLRIYDNGTPKAIDSTKGDDKYAEYKMIKGDKGVFAIKIDGDLAGKYYTYVVTNAAYNKTEIVDPYAKSTGINGLRGMIVDFSLTNPAGWDSVEYLDYDRKQLTVWETHVADVTSSDSWNGSSVNKRKYLGLIEEGTTYSENGVTVSTGFDHIKELGINAIQLIPVFDQANDETSYTFNWGYNPLNYNALDGMYSIDPYDGYAKIREFKQVVAKMNEAGIIVIMDVVYNHVNGAVGSNFDVLMPKYYFRYNNGKLSNGSGCGNETASENAMMRKFMIDSICFWLKEYKLGGFRFDLMGLHDIETMNQLTAAAKKINSNVVIYGEPWTGGNSPLALELQARQANGNEFKGFGQFNDQMRDALIKGGLNAASDKGWVTNDEAVLPNDVKAIVNGINGITYSLATTISDPNKTVNYVTCHDNYTLYDRIKAAGITDEETIKKMAVLANSVVLTSNGTSFMLAAEEMLRSKKGDCNSYQSSDEINQIDYALKIKNYDVFEAYKKLIAFKQKVSALASDNNYLSIETIKNGSAIMYKFESDGVKYIVIHGNGTVKDISIDTVGYYVYLDTLGKYSGSVSKVDLQPYQTVILSSVKN